MSRARPAPPHSLLLALRVVGAVLLAAMAGIHLYLWSVGYRDIDWIGPLFLVNVLAGVVLALAVLAPPRRWPGGAAALGAMLQAGTLGGLILSVWVGLFGFVETTRATLFWPSVLVEAAGAVVLAVLAALEYLPARTPADVPDSDAPGLMRTRGDGGESGLRALYDAHAVALLGYALRICGGDRARAEDLVQETLVRAWRHLDVLDPTAAPIRPWLFTVAQHLAIDAHRARQARPPEVGEAALAAVPDLDELDGVLERIVIVDALGSLSPEHRAVIVETYYRGRTVAEAARVLGVPPGTVKSRCHYALRALKLALAERGVTT